MLDIGISSPKLLINLDCSEKQRSIAVSKIKLLPSSPIQVHKHLTRKLEETM